MKHSSFIYLTIGFIPKYFCIFLVFSLFQHFLCIKSPSIIIVKIALHSAAVMFTILWKHLSKLVHLIDLTQVPLWTSGSFCCAAIIVDIAHSGTHCHCHRKTSSIWSYYATPQHFKPIFMDHGESFNKLNQGWTTLHEDKMFLSKFRLDKAFQLSERA